MSEFAEKLGDLLLGGLGSVARTLLPDHWKRQAKARLSDFNPFDIIRGNHDLTRAVRLAWIEAALKVLEAARLSRPRSSSNAQSGMLHDFIDAAERDLRDIRHAAWDRRGDVGPSSIDRHLEAVLHDAPAFVAPGVDRALAAPLTIRFTETLAAITNWPSAEIPALPGQIAQSGLPTADGRASRSFGELVFAAFVELLNDPNKYPEAGPAFSIAMQNAARKLAQETLMRLEGVDTKLDTILARLDAGRVIEAGATGYLSLLPRLLEGQTQLQRTVDSLNAVQAAGVNVAAERHAELLAAIAQERGVPLAALRAQLTRLGEVNVPCEQIASRLEAFVTEFLKLQKDLTRPSNTDPEVAATRARALTLFNDGDLDGARTMFASMLAGFRERRQRAAFEEAVLLADRARIDMLQVRYSDAIAAYDEAANLVRFDAESVRGYLLLLADALSAQGTDFGNNVALRRAIEILNDRVLPLESRKLTPLNWAATQNSLANVLSTLGERESGTARLEEAVIAYRAALEEVTRERAPLDWAVLQNNLGSALRGLGERESGTARLEEAVIAYRAGLEESTRGRVPLNWAMTQNNLGVALSRLGERESGTARLEEAVIAYRAALEERTRERVPLDCAMTQNNLGNALWNLGERESGTARLEEAVIAYRAALEEKTRERVPLGWATTQNNLGNALWRLGERESGTGCLEEAVIAYRAGLEEVTRERAPLNWAITQNNLGNALSRLGERESGTGRLEEAVIAYRAGLEEVTRERSALNWATTQSNLGNTLWMLGERENGTARLEEALITYRAALELLAPRHAQMIQANVDKVLRLISDRRTS